MKKLTVVVFGLLALASLIPLPETSARLGQQIQNSGHLLLGASLAALLLALNLVPSRFANHRHLFFFLLAALILTVLEAAQYPLARDASIADLVLGLIAAASVILVHFALTKCRRGAAVLLTALGGLLMLSGFLPLLGYALAYKARDHRFPQLSDFSSRNGRLFIETRHAELTPDSFADDASLSARLCLKQERWAGLTVDEIYSDWTGFDYLLFDIQAENPSERPLSFRVNDLRNDQTFKDRFTREIELEPGINRLAVPLAIIESLPSGRKMAMDQIDRIVLFSSEQDARSCFYISDFNLLKGTPKPGYRILE